MSWLFKELLAFFKKKPAPTPAPKTPVLTFEVGDFLSEDEVEKVRREVCPDCGAADSFQPIPRRVRSANPATHYKCGGATCGSEFRTIFPFGTQRLTDACPLTPRTETVFHDPETPFRG